MENKTWMLTIGDKEYPCEKKVYHQRMGLFILTLISEGVRKIVNISILNNVDYDWCSSGLPLETIGMGSKGKAFKCIISYKTNG